MVCVCACEDACAPGESWGELRFDYSVFFFEYFKSDSVAVVTVSRCWQSWHPGGHGQRSYSYPAAGAPPDHPLTPPDDDREQGQPAAAGPPTVVASTGTRQR